MRGHKGHGDGTDPCGEVRYGKVVRTRNANHEERVDQRGSLIIRTGSYKKDDQRIAEKGWSFFFTDLFIHNVLHHLRSFYQQKHNMRIAKTFFFILITAPLFVQGAIVHWAYGPFGTMGDAAYIVENDRIYQACGPFGEKGSCLFVFDGTQVFRSSDAFGRKGTGVYLLEGENLTGVQERSAQKDPVRCSWKATRSTGLMAHSVPRTAALSSLKATRSFGRRAIGHQDRAIYRQKGMYQLLRAGDLAGL